ncbi:MAG: ATP-binding protein [Chloroflexota bacterium]
MIAWLADLFETNRIIVLSVYGQVFFVLGLAIALQSRKRSRLALARSLPWLAAFGILHAFVEWGYLFIPIQSGFLPASLIEALLWAQLAMKAISFGLLLQFGAELLLSTRLAETDGLGAEAAPGESRAVATGPFGQPWLRLAPSIVLALWAAGTYLLSVRVTGFELPTTITWLDENTIRASLAAVGAPLFVGDVVARWMLALPAAVLVVIGLLRSARALGPLALPPVGTALRVAAGAFAVYALLGGVIGMPAPFPPADILNGQAILNVIGVPIEVWRSMAGLFIAVAIVRSLQLFEQETDRQLAESRRRELLLRERERIGRDLHDGIIQSIYAAGLHLEEASAALDAPAPGAGPSARIATVMDELNRITNDIRAYIFDLRSASLDTRDPEEIVASVADELRANTLVRVEMAVQRATTRRAGATLAPDEAEELRHVVHEAFSNVLRHAQATCVSVDLSIGTRRLELAIRDDGIGFDPAAVEATKRADAHGLANMRRRAQLLSARLEVTSAPGRGTALSLTMPIGPARRPARRRVA